MRITNVLFEIKMKIKELERKKFDWMEWNGRSYLPKKLFTSIK